MDRELEKIVEQVRTNIAHSSIPSEGDDRRYARALLKWRNPDRSIFYPHMGGMYAGTAIGAILFTIESTRHLTLFGVIGPAAAGLGIAGYNFYNVYRNLKEYSEVCEDSRKNQ